MLSAEQASDEVDGQMVTVVYFVWESLEDNGFLTLWVQYVMLKKFIFCLWILMH